MRERTLFQQAVEIADPAEQRRFLDDACRGDAPLRERLDELLRAARQIGDFLEAPALAGDAAPDRAAGSASQGATQLFEPDASDVVSFEGPASTMTAHVTTMLPDSRLSFLEPSDQPGSLGRLGHYEILEVLGQGAFGIVLRARDEKLQRIVAIKAMQPHLAQTSPPRKRFLREARACAAIRHPNVVSVYSVEEEPIPYLVMEYIDGMTLQDKIDDAGPLDIDQIIPLAKQLAHALEAAHRLGLIHRDIKPSNILLERSPQPRAIITDFGLARTVDDASLTQSGYVAGTPMYMSPEQARGLPLDARSDLFSLGSVLYVVVTGRPPFRASSSLAVLKRVCEAVPRPIGEIIPEAPQWLCAMIGKLHAKQPDERFSSAKELADFLDQVEADLLQNEQAREQAALQRLQHTEVRKKPVRRSGSLALSRFMRWPYPALLVLLALIIGIGLWRPWMSRPSAEPRGSSAETASPLARSSLQSDARHASAPWQKMPGDAPALVMEPFDANTAKELQQRWADYLRLPVEFTNSAGIRFRLIPPSGFAMGCDPEESTQQLSAAHGMPFWESCIRSQSPKHQVVITEPFYLATTEVTQNQFESVMSRNPSAFSATGAAAEAVAGVDTLNFPVEGLSWDRAAEFCRMLSLRDGLESPYSFEGGEARIASSVRGYALPTEARWEMACRAGTATRYWTGNTADELKKAAHFGGKRRYPAPVGQLAANPFGLFDVHGNVNEWVQDSWAYGYYEQCLKKNIVLDPLGTEEPTGQRITKGGDFHYSAGECLSAARFATDPHAVPIYADGVRPALPWSAAQSAIAAGRKRTVPQTTDFVEIHGATLTELREWLDHLPPSFVPHAIGVRHGSQPPQLDAVASLQSSPAPCEVHLTSDFEEDFHEMRSSHRPAWRMTIPPGEARDDDDSGDAANTTDAAAGSTSLALWVMDNALWSTWPVEADAIQQRVEELSDAGYMPNCLSAYEADGTRTWELSVVYRPGVGHHTYLELTVDEFAEKVQQYRGRGWRLCLLQAIVGSAEPRLTAVFCDNALERQWDLSLLISEEEYEKQQSWRKAAAFYPASVVSLDRDGKTEFIVLWCQSEESAAGP